MFGHSIFFFVSSRAGMLVLCLNCISQSTDWYVLFHRGVGACVNRVFDLRLPTEYHT
jgi:hypothetical protein